MTTKTRCLQLASSRVLSYAVTSPSPSTSPPSSSSSSSSSLSSLLGNSGGQQPYPFVLLSSALLAPFTIWDPVVPRLTALGLNVLRFDAPGHGSSGVPSNLSSTTFDSLARDIRALLDHLGIERLHAWIGVSLGAATAVVFAAKYPGVVERLVPCDTVSCSPTNGGIPDALGLRIAAAREAGSMDASIEGTLENWFGRAWLNAHPAETRRVRAVMRGTSLDGFEACCVALRSTSFDLRPLAARAGSHVGAALLLVGEKDVSLFQTMEDLRRRIECGLRASRGSTASVQMKVVRDGGHLCFVDGFESFISIVAKFLS
ncbi:putative 3-oxoadipate enol-lactonase [Rosellinia necatrix]|uniref:Putative 3-oxoadipate enol-lactonase n=1 Tax=Rosellinia necatrix TaxID=77044 RepID=A0A1W2TPP1_ROSNE|nr:putative 3-oxoadipate enol-lactonase [Rosellinia necatrix]